MYLINHEIRRTQRFAGLDTRQKGRLLAEDRLADRTNFPPLYFRPTLHYERGVRKYDPSRAQPLDHHLFGGLE